MRHFGNYVLRIVCRQSLALRTSKLGHVPLGVTSPVTAPVAGSGGRALDPVTPASRPPLGVVAPVTAPAARSGGRALSPVTPAASGSCADQCCQSERTMVRRIVCRQSLALRASKLDHVPLGVTSPVATPVAGSGGRALGPVTPASRPPLGVVALVTAPAARSGGRARSPVTPAASGSCADQCCQSERTMVRARCVSWTLVPVALAWSGGRAVAR